MSTHCYPAETHVSEESAAPATHVANEPELDFSRLDIDAEQLVASLFGDDDSSVSFEQPPTDNKKGFVSVDHEDAAKWFYQDPQGVIQGEEGTMCYIFLILPKQQIDCNTKQTVNAEREREKKNILQVKLCLI